MLFPRRAFRSHGAPSPAKPAAQPPQPTHTAMYCRPSSVYVIGEAWCPEPHWKLQRALPVSASYAVKNPSASPVKTRPPPVASTPATIGERVATSHLVWPVFTSIALNEPDAWLSIRVSDLPQ